MTLAVIASSNQNDQFPIASRLKARESAKAARNISDAVVTDISPTAGSPWDALLRISG